MSIFFGYEYLYYKTTRFREDTHGAYFTEEIKPGLAKPPL